MHPHRNARSAARSGGKRCGVDHIGDGKATAWFEYAERLAIDLLLVRNEVNHAIRDHHVGGVVGDWQVLDLAEAELDIRGADLLGIRACLGQHLMRHVDADHRPAGPTCRAARKQSIPAPLPRSTTTSPGRIAASACGLPQPSPRSAPSGKEASSASE